MLRLIEERYGSDAAFERAAGLIPKTVSNWRRARSRSYLRLIAELSELLGVSPSELLAVGETDPGEAELIKAWRGTDCLPPEERRALLAALCTLMELSSRSFEE